MTVLPHLAARLFGVPLAIHRPKLDIILSVLGARIGLADLAAPVGYTPAARASTPASGKVAVISIHGTLVRRTSGLEAESGLASYTGIAAQLDASLASPEVAAILLDVDSPGGESGGVFDLADRIRAASQVKPVWAVANDMAFSASALATAFSISFWERTPTIFRNLRRLRLNVSSFMIPSSKCPLARSPFPTVRDSYGLQRLAICPAAPDTPRALGPTSRFATAC